MKKIDWSKLVPVVETVKYTKEEQPVSLGIEFTSRYTGFGLGIGFGRFDFWIGWPTPARASCLHHESCVPALEV